jgi:hypothetical protein
MGAAFSLLLAEAEGEAYINSAVFGTLHRNILLAFRRTLLEERARSSTKGGADI